MSSIAPTNGVTAGEIMEQVIAAGDLSKLSPADRAHYVVRVAESVGLNPLTKPFDLITLNGKLTLYTTKTATDQLRQLHKVDLVISEQRQIGDVWQVTVQARTPDGRTDTDIGCVTMGALKGDALANALMKAVTKAKRRVTLSICGLGVLDESEIETIPRDHKWNHQPAPPQPSIAVNVVEADEDIIDAETGEIETVDSVMDDIKTLSAELGFDGKAIQGLAKSIKADYRTIEGAIQLRSSLLGMVPEEPDADRWTN